MIVLSAFQAGTGNGRQARRMSALSPVPLPTIISVFHAANKLCMRRMQFIISA
jgi:hypothetical protein